MKKIRVKRSLRSVVALVSIFMLSLSFVQLSAYASDDLTEILIAEALLINSEEREAIEALSADIIEMANGFEGFHAEVSDIDFSKAYCVFVKADILAEEPETKEELEKFLDSAQKVWNVPVHANGKTVLVQVGKGVELSATIPTYEGEGVTVTEAGLGDILSWNNINADKCKCLLIEGEPGIRTLCALLLENDTISGAISLARTVAYAGGGENDIVLQQNQIYSLSEFAKVSQNAGERWLVDDGWLLNDGRGSLSSGNGVQGIAVEYYIIGGVVLGIMVLIGIFSRRYFINRHKIKGEDNKKL